VRRDDGEGLSEHQMKVPLRRVLSRLTALALAATVIGPTNTVLADPDDLVETKNRERELDDLETDPESEIDPGPIDPADAALALGRGLALALVEMRPLAATELAATWAISPDPLRRLALGVALEWRFRLVGDAFVIDQLARDSEPTIRIAAARAAWIRRPVGGDLGVLDRLADDPDPEVRAIALAARSG
jgi:hypothetical protein